MHEHTAAFYDVLIAGAGPVGLFLACELRLAGCSVLILERAETPDSPLKNLPFGLRGLSIPTIENFDRRDLLAALMERASCRSTRAAAHWMNQKRQPAGHFAGIQFFQDQVDTARWTFRLPGATGSVAADMASIESVLAARAVALGAEIKRGFGVEAFEQSACGVTVRAGGGTFRGGWLVGCDGGRSTVRKAAGINVAGTEPEFTGYSVQVDLAEPNMLKLGRHYTPAGMYTYAAPGTIAMVDFDGGAFHRSDEITREHVESVLRKVTGTGVVVKTLELATTWTDRAFQASEYVKDRVVLAGDAAHIHSPLGGQGLNLGLGDAMNLGWKLAATIRGGAPDGFLETYTRERYPVGAQILDWSRAQVVLMRPSQSSRALESIMRDVIATDDGATYFAERVWGVGLRYDLDDSHPLVGRSAPNFATADDSSLSAKMRTARGIFLDFGKRAERRALAGRWSDRIDYVAGGPGERLGVSAILVRPDGIVAWAEDNDDNDDGAAAACSRWFGDALV